MIALVGTEVAEVAGVAGEVVVNDSKSLDDVDVIAVVNTLVCVDMVKVIDRLGVGDMIEVDGLKLL
jgi:hypothetical protein